MKVLLVNGSPDKKGCCGRGLDEIAKVLKNEGIESEAFWIGNQPIGGCMACGYCHTHEGCVLKDSVNAFALKAQAADGFIFASPVYYASMAGNMKAFMDRLFYSNGEFLRGKVAASVISSRRAGSTSVYDEFNKYFGINQMVIVSSRYWNEIHGSSAEEVEQDEEGLYTMRVLAHRMAYVLQCLEAGKKEGVVDHSSEEKPFRTNFIR